MTATATAKLAALTRRQRRARRRALWRALGLAALGIWATLVSVLVLSYGLVYLMALGD